MTDLGVGGGGSTLALQAAATSAAAVFHRLRQLRVKDERASNSSRHENKFTVMVLQRMLAGVYSQRGQSLKKGFQLRCPVSQWSSFRRGERE